MKEVTPREAYIEILAKANSKSHACSRGRRRAMERAIAKVTAKYGTPT